MTITFKNLSDEVDAVLAIDNDEILIDKSSVYEIETDKKEISFSVVFNRDFKLDTSGEKSDKLSEWLGNSIGNFFVQIKNTYIVSGLLDGDIIELNERAHYVPATKREAFYKCLPALYYFGEAECENAGIDVVLSNAINRDEFVGFYKKFLRIFNLSGAFRILKYMKQIKRQKRISSDETLTKRFKELYQLSDEEREYQFRPIQVIFDRIIELMLSKLPKKLRAKAARKIEEVKESIFN